MNKHSQKRHPVLTHILPLMICYCLCCCPIVPTVGYAADPVSAGGSLGEKKVESNQGGEAGGQKTVSSLGSAISGLAGGGLMGFTGNPLFGGIGALLSLIFKSIGGSDDKSK